MAKELYYFENRTSDADELLELVDGWMIDKYDYDTIHDLMWIYHEDIAFIAKGIQVYWDDDAHNYTVFKGNTLGSLDFLKNEENDLKAHDALVETEDQYAFEDYIRNNTHDDDLLELINLSKYDKYYIITA